ncbi:hypothetical protein M8C17_17675 [Micromonospora sp. RHAY321]|uniref:hypothetical protein n=1 Tax=Micromonospora sp. RHAY321 TaxID=2944807 RepID=UPI00207D1DBB|nr:hypothetical protein [Micromonospora sp. RHAY321]MCO1596988.1 hypothetical protein [Micromonospora sp. RHAY321]
MKLLKTLAISGAVAAALVMGTAAPASADAYSYNGYGSANFESAGDYITLTHYTYDPYPGHYASYAEWYTNYGRTGFCGDNIGGRLGCNEDVAENRYITIRVCTRYGVFNQVDCGDWATSRT